MFGVDFVDLFPSLVFLDYISPFNICFKAGFVVLNYLNICLSEKLFISPSILNEIFVAYGNLVVDFSLSVFEIYPAIPFQAAEFLLNDQLLNIWGFSLVCYLLLLPCCF